MRSEGKKRTLELSLIQGFSKIEKLFGGATRKRTGDTKIFTPLLCQLCYGTFVIPAAKIGIIFNTAIVWQRKYEIFVQREWKSFFLF